jgi:hypothetical protein
VTTSPPVPGTSQYLRVVKAMATHLGALVAELTAIEQGGPVPPEPCPATVRRVAGTLIALADELMETGAGRDEPAGLDGAPELHTWGPNT